MRWYWIVLGLLAAGFFTADGVVTLSYGLGKANWYGTLLLILAALSLTGVWMGWRRIRETGTVLTFLALFQALFSGALPGDWSLVQLIGAGVVFILALAGLARDPAAYTPAGSLRPVPASRHILLSQTTLVWFWTAVASAQAAFIVIDGASFLRRPEITKTPGNVVVSGLILFVIASGLLLAWRRVPNAGVVFVFASVASFLFSFNLGPYYLETLMIWQILGSTFLFLIALFGLVTTPSQTQNPAVPER